MGGVNICGRFFPKFMALQYSHCSINMVDQAIRCNIFVYEIFRCLIQAEILPETDIATVRSYGDSDCL